MAVLALSDFQNKLHPLNYTFSLSSNVKSSRDASGITYRVGRGTRIWGGSINFAPWSKDEQRRAEAFLSNSEEADTYWLFSPWEAKQPKNYTGTGFTNVQTNGTQVSGNSLKIKNVPSGFAFRAGDLCSIQINGVHRMFRIRSDTNATGTTATIAIEPKLTVGGLPAANTVVSFLNPVCTVQTVPGSVSYGSVYRDFAEGGSLQFIQSFRV